MEICLSVACVSALVQTSHVGRWPCVQTCCRGTSLSGPSWGDTKVKMCLVFRWCLKSSEGFSPIEGVVGKTSGFVWESKTVIFFKAWIASLGGGQLPRHNDEVCRAHQQQHWSWFCGHQLWVSHWSRIQQGKLLTCPPPKCSDRDFFFFFHFLIDKLRLPILQSDAFCVFILQHKEHRYQHLRGSVKH